jgi:hypothetical protein
MLAILLIAGLLVVGPVLAVPAMAEGGVRPCVYVQVGPQWVRQCSPLVFTAMTCYTLTSWGGDLPYTEADACVPTEL